MGTGNHCTALTTVTVINSVCTNEICHARADRCKIVKVSNVTHRYASQQY